jgi:Na+/serine symporter
MKKPLETLGGLLVIGGVAGIVHLLVGWAPFGVVTRVARAAPYVRDHEIGTYAALIAVGLAVLVGADKVADPRDGEEPSECDGG